MAGPDLAAVLAGAVGGHRAPGAQVALWNDGALRTACAGPGIGPDTRFEIGSITKVLVAACVVEHVVAGRLDLDDPVRRLLPGFRPVADGITVRQLLQHTSGLDGADDVRDTGDDDGAVRRYVEEHLAGTASIHPAGARWSYCNAGYIVAGRLLEVLEDRSFDDVLAGRFARAGMEATTTRPVAPPDLPVAPGHRLDPSTGIVEPFDATLPRSTGPAGATVLTTAADLVTLGRSFATSEGWPEAAVQQAMLASSVPIRDGRQALGWTLAAGPTTVLSHGGTTASFSALLTVIPEARGAMAVLANGPGAAGIAMAVTAALGLPTSPEPAVLAPLPVEQLRPYVGRYGRRGVVQTVDLTDDGQLRATAEFDHSVVGPFLPPPPMTLSPVAEHCFVGRGPWDDLPQRYDFLEPDAGGRPGQLFTARIHRRIDA
jgi:CubicO group peptidase (beta-lactamase class C family)